uniref:Uncharacterized protein n=1 Tax=Glossina pallidipes TaxID=7398 RepID=A0A1B0A1U4_GLOPL
MDTEFITTKNAFTIPFNPNLKSDLKQVAVVKNFGRNIEKQPSDVSLHRAERSVLDLFAILSAMYFQQPMLSIWISMQDNIRCLNDHSSSSGECVDVVIKEDKERMNMKH